MKGGSLDTVECFDGENWAPAEKMGSVRYGHAAVVFQDKIYVLDGIGEGREVHSTMQVHENSSIAPLGPV